MAVNSIIQVLKALQEIKAQSLKKSDVLKARDLRVPSLRNVALRYQRFLVTYQTAVNKATTELLKVPRNEVVRSDGIDETITQAFVFLGDALVEWLSNDLLMGGILRTSSQVGTLNFDKYDKGLYKQIGVNGLPGNIEQEIINNWISSNVGLITKTNRNQAAALENLFRDNAFSGVRSGDLEAAINKIYNGSKNNVALIARDQTMKLNHYLDKAKQQYAGIPGYYWRGSRDERERLKHAMREGKYYDWDNPPEGGHPGFEYQCRCTAEASVDKALLSDEEWKEEQEKRAPEEELKRKEAIAKAKEGPIRKKKKSRKS